MLANQAMEEAERVSTGVPGLDEILGGGLPARGNYLLLGQPGTGKTTIGLQFLIEGARRGEKCLYLCMAETHGQLKVMAESARRCSVSTRARRTS